MPKELPLSRDADVEGAERYILDDRTRLALRMAHGARRPLLVVGEAGCGKTQLATALACAWRVPLLKQVMHAHSKAEDLLYHFDAVARLADAQVYAALREENKGQTSDPLDAVHYLRPGPMWWAWDWATAHTLRLAKPPVQPEDWQADQGCVVLIDEIDKAGGSAEGLLEVLDTGGFDVPWTGQSVLPRQDGPGAAPLVIITSNGARELPAPFLRRCIVLAMTVPETDLEAWLVQRARAHFAEARCPDPVPAKAATIIAQDRHLAGQAGRYVPGVAEYLDLLRAAVELVPAGNADAQIALLADLAPHVTVDKGKAVVA